MAQTGRRTESYSFRVHGTSNGLASKSTDVSSLVNQTMCRVCDLLHLAVNRYVKRKVLLSFLVLLTLFAKQSKSEQPEAPKHPAYFTVAAIMALPPEQAAKGDPAHVRGVVSQSLQPGLVLHDGTAGIWIYLDHAEKYSAGDEIEVQVRTPPGLFAPVIFADSIRTLGRAPLPKPPPVTFRQLSCPKLNSLGPVINFRAYRAGSRSLVILETRSAVHEEYGRGVLCLPGQAFRSRSR